MSAGKTKGKQEGEDEHAGILNIPCTLQKVGTMASGGWRLTFDAPETAATQVKELIGRENNTVFVLCLVEADKIQPQETPQRAKCKPKPKEQP